MMTHEASPADNHTAGPTTPEARDLAAHQRDQQADARDRDAIERHRQADLRDLAATGRDALGDATVTARPTAAELLALYLECRRTAAEDRLQASADRHADATDQLAAAHDRHLSAADRRASAEDRERASLDALTGAYTRAAGLKELRRDLDRARRTRLLFTLAFVDVDRLKAINDTGGHAAGDRALVRVVQELRANLRHHDLVVRYGGDEFLVAAAALSATELAERLERVNQATAQEPEPVGITTGLASLQPEETLDALIERADSALYTARRSR